MEKNLCCGERFCSKVLKAEEEVEKNLRAGIIKDELDKALNS